MGLGGDVVGRREGGRSCAVCLGDGTSKAASQVSSECAIRGRGFAARVAKKTVACVVCGGGSGAFV